MTCEYCNDTGITDGYTYDPQDEAPCPCTCEAGRQVESDADDAALEAAISRAEARDVGWM